MYVETIQHSVAIAAAIATMFVGWWSGTQTPEPPDTTDALQVQ